MSSPPLRLAIVVGSTRPGRNGAAVGQWVLDTVRSVDAVELYAGENTEPLFVVELVDLATLNLPMLDEPVPPLYASYSQPHTKAWSATVASYDAFLFVTPEYNHSVSPALANAISYLYKEWNNKAAGFVSYGGAAGGVRAVEHLRNILAELEVATVRNQVALNLYDDFVQFKEFKPRAQHRGALVSVLKQLHAWAGAMRQVRCSQ